MALVREQVGENAADYEAWWRISKFSCYLARHTNGPDKSRYIDAAVEAGNRAVALVPNRPEGHYWLGVDLGLQAQSRGYLKALSMVDSIRKEVETVIRLDPDYEEAGGLRTLARLVFRAPFFKGGDKRRAVALLQDAQKRYPSSALTMIYLADSYLALGRREEARRQLENVLKLCPDPQYGPEQEENRQAARERLAKLEADAR